MGADTGGLQGQATLGNSVCKKGWGHLAQKPNNRNHCGKQYRRLAMWFKWPKMNHVMSLKDTEEEMGTANEHKKVPLSREARNKIKIRYHLLPSRLAVRRAADNIRCCWGCRGRCSQRLLGGGEMSTTALKGKLASFIKTESFTSYDPEIAMFPRKTLSCVGQELVPGMLRADSVFVRTQMFRNKREPE